MAAVTIVLDCYFSLRLNFTPKYFCVFHLYIYNQNTRISNFLQFSLLHHIVFNYLIVTSL